MRWYEIIRESQDEVSDIARDTILDILTPLQSMGVSSITLLQVKDQLKRIPELQGIDLTDDFIQDLADGIEGLTLEPNDQGVLSIKIDDNTSIKPDKKNEKDKKKTDDKVNQLAMNTVKKDLQKIGRAHV